LNLERKFLFRHPIYRVWNFVDLTNHFKFMYIYMYKLIYVQWIKYCQIWFLRREKKRKRRGKNFLIIFDGMLDKFLRRACKCFLLFDRNKYFYILYNCYINNGDISCSVRWLILYVLMIHKKRIKEKREIFYFFYLQ